MNTERDPLVGVARWTLTDHDHADRRYGGPMPPRSGRFPAPQQWTGRLADRRGGRSLPATCPGASRPASRHASPTTPPSVCVGFLSTSPSGRSIDARTEWLRAGVSMPASPATNLTSPGPMAAHVLTRTGVPPACSPWTSTKRWRWGSITASGPSFLQSYLDEFVLKFQHAARNRRGRVPSFITAPHRQACTQPVHALQDVDCRKQRDKPHQITSMRSVATQTFPGALEDCCKSWGMGGLKWSRDTRVEHWDARPPTCGGSVRISGKQRHRFATR